MATTFIIDQKRLLSVLSFMQPICTKRTTLDATSSILFQVGHKELILKSTDLEISLHATCLLPHHDMNEPYSFLVSGKRIFDLVKELVVHG
jgi:DNA polymerase III sliding clamp (beta) subunit (PCNA family)